MKWIDKLINTDGFDTVKLKKPACGRDVGGNCAIVCIKLGYQFLYKY